MSVFRRCALLALATVNWACSPCDTHGILETEDHSGRLDCTATLHPAGRPDAVIESSRVRAGWEFWYRRKRGMPDGPLQITFRCPGYRAVTTAPFEWRPRLLGFWNCPEVQVGTITLPRVASKPGP